MAGLSEEVTEHDPHGPIFRLLQPARLVALDQSGNAARRLAVIQYLAERVGVPGRILEPGQRFAELRIGTSPTNEFPF